MATYSVVNSYNLFLDSGRMIASNSTGDNVILPLGQTPITCGSNQFLRLSLSSFSMTKSWLNINSNNNTFRINQTQNLATAPLLNTSNNNTFTLTPANYLSPFSLGQNFATQLANALSTHTGVALAATPISSFLPVSSTTMAGDGGTIISFQIDFSGAHGMTDLNIQFQIPDGDIYQILGGNKINDLTDTTTQSIFIYPASIAALSTSVKVSCHYGCKLTTINNIYLKTDLATTNLQSESYISRNTDSSTSGQLSSSRILGKIIPDTQFANFTTSTNNEYFVNVLSKNITHMSLRVTDPHDRPIPINSSGLTGSTLGDTKGNRFFECVILVEVLEYLTLGSNMFNSPPLPELTSPRFSSAPMTNINNGESSWITTIDLMIKALQSKKLNLK